MCFSDFIVHVIGRPVEIHVLPKRLMCSKKSSQAKMPGGLLTYMKDLVKLARDLARPAPQNVVFRKGNGTP